MQTARTKAKEEADKLQKQIIKEAEEVAHIAAEKIESERKETATKSANEEAERIQTKIRQEAKE